MNIISVSHNDTPVFFGMEVNGFPNEYVIIHPQEEMVMLIAKVVDVLSEAEESHIVRPLDDVFTVRTTNGMSPMFCKQALDEIAKMVVKFVELEDELSLTINPVN
jgi:hypothetical protein